MTRIIAGQWAGRRLKVPASGSRPTTDRVREALFNWLAHRHDWDGSRVLDLYAGSGALGIEALSRGAEHATFVERNPKAAVVIKSNLELVGAEGTVLTADVGRWLRSAEVTDADLVFVDPPYDLPVAELAEVLTQLATKVHPSALVVVERSARDPKWQWPTGWLSLDSRTYGETALWYGHHDSGDPVEEGSHDGQGNLPRLL